MVYARLIFLLGLMTVVFADGLASDAYARRGLPIPIIWGSGEEVAELGELPPDAASALGTELGGEPKVAFIYERAHVYWCDLWTWNGRHVITAGDRYFELEPAQWKGLVGDDAPARFGKPFFYRVPLVPMVVVAGAVLYGVRKKFFKTEAERLQAVMKDRRYKVPIETLNPHYEVPDSPVLMTRCDERRFMDAKNQLIAKGIKPQVAEQNLRLVADAIVGTNNAWVDSMLSHGESLAEQGEWGESAQVFTSVHESLADSDPRKEVARKGISLAAEHVPSDPAKPADENGEPGAEQV